MRGEGRGGCKLSIFRVLCSLCVYIHTYNEYVFLEGDLQMCFYEVVL